MLMPKRTKFRKSHRLSYDGHAKGNTELSKYFPTLTYN